MPRPHLSDHQKLAQARAEIARLRKVAGAKAEPLTDATRRKLEGELIKVKLENDRLREQLAAKWQRRRARSRSCASKSRCCRRRLPPSPSPPSLHRSRAFS